MVEIEENLYVGSEYDCAMRSVRAVVHACKHPCHVNAVGYRGSLPQSHPNYLVKENESDLYLNMVDMERELSPVYTNPIMAAAMKFLDTKLGSSQTVLIHCNQGQSRAPSIGLLHLARSEKIANDSYEAALLEFRRVYPGYSPARGISLYLINNWTNLMEL